MLVITDPLQENQTGIVLRATTSQPAVPTPGNKYIIQILRFAPAFGSIYDVYILIGGVGLGGGAHREE